MDKRGMDAAETEFRRATAKALRLNEITDVSEAADAWTEFLTSFNRVFTKLEQASKIGNSQSWFANIKRLRKETPELSYLLHARNADEHGIALVYHEAKRDRLITTPGNVLDREIAFEDGDQVSVRFSFGDETKVEVRENRIELTKVFDRGVWYAAPIAPDSNWDDPYSPKELAAAGMKAISIIIEEARTRVKAKATAL